MTEAELAFLAHIRADTEDDDRRLVYADWLDEQGEAERAELVRIQVARSRPFYPGEYAELVLRERELWRQCGATWREHFGVPNVWERGLPALVCHDLEELTEACRALDESGLAERIAEVVIEPPYSASDAEIPALTASPFWRRVSTVRGGGSFHCTALTAQALAESPHSGGLRALTFQGTQLGVEGAQALAGSPHLVGLRTLRLSECRVYPAGVEALAASPYLVGLWHLDLSDNGDGAYMLPALAESAALVNLRSLNLRGGVGFGHGLRYLGKSEAFPALQQLNLEGNRITDAGLADLLRWPGLAHLTHLSLADNRIGEEGALALANQSALAGLRVLDLSKNRVGNMGARALAESPYLTSLRWLSLRANRKISPTLRKQLKERPVSRQIDI